MFPGDDHRELFSSFGWIFFSPRCTGSFLLHIHCSVPCQELKIDCGPQSNLSVCAALTPLSVLSLLSLPRLLSVSTQRVHWVLPALLFYLFLCCTRFPPAFVFAVSSSPRSSQRLPFCHSHLSLNVPSQERPHQLHPQLLSTVSLCLIFVTVLLPT